MAPKKGKKVYIVTMTTFEDDYKHRYDSGVYPQKPQTFSTLKKAENYVMAEIMDGVNQDENIDKFDAVDEYFDKVEKDGEVVDYKLKKKFKTLASITGLYEHFFKGEFVDYTMEYQITEQTI